jgi:menaquinone-dependent protoporphyrinogen oxidase
MPRALLAYSTVDGHTRAICKRIKHALDATGHAEMFEIRGTTPPDLASFDLIVIGASIRYGKHRPNVYAFIEANRAALDQKPSAFFSVNLVARKPGKDTPDANPYIRTFRRKTSWTPSAVAVFAGKLVYPTYGFLDRQVIRLIMWLTDGPTDPSACVDFTDWNAVDGFAQKLADLMRGDAPTPDAGARR